MAAIYKAIIDGRERLVVGSSYFDWPGPAGLVYDGATVYAVFVSCGNPLFVKTEVSKADLDAYLAAGSGNPSNIDMPFSFGDSTPKLLGSAVIGKLIETVAIIITVPFNGAAPSLTVGDSLDPISLMPANMNDPQAAATYEVHPNVLFPDARDLLLTIVPGAGASAGVGVVSIMFQP